MKFLELNRMETGPQGTLGVLLLNKKILCCTLEPPWRDNLRDKSCIPTGQYLCRRYDSQKYKVPCLGLADVPGRDYISIHYGNRVTDTDGCILVGTYCGEIGGRRAVMRSRPALKALMFEIRDIAHLTIREGF